jgi:hypothetical protein
VAVVVACGTTVDGTPVDPKALVPTACAADLDCGRGRYCTSEGACAIECVTSKDCALYQADPSAANTAECSACGRCVAPGTRDTACLSVVDQPCASTDECQALYGADYACSEHDLCARVCAGDADCREIGRGFGCGDAGLCLRKCFRDADCYFHGFQYACALPDGVDPAENEQADAPVYGECLADPAGVTFPTLDPSEPASGYQGVWGFMIGAAVRVTGVPVLTSVDSVQVHHVLVKVTGDGDTLTLRFKWCADEIRNFNENDGPATNLFQIVVPDLNVDSVRVYDLGASSVPALSAGAAFDTARLVDLRGADLADPANDPLPSYKDLTGQWDQDRDGHPGMTVNATGLLSGDMYQSTRWQPVFHATVVDADHLQGLVDGPSDATTLGATVDTLVNDAVTAAHPQPDRSYFRAVRLADEASCLDVIELGTTAGGWLDYPPHYDDSARP